MFTDFLIVVDSDDRNVAGDAQGATSAGAGDPCGSDVGRGEYPNWFFQFADPFLKLDGDVERVGDVRARTEFDRPVSVQPDEIVKRLIALAVPVDLLGPMYVGIRLSCR